MADVTIADLTYSVGPTGVGAAITELRAALDQETATGMLAVAAVVADEARARHPYENRTGDLQAATVPGAVTGTLSAGSLGADVVGETEYGSYVETVSGGRFAFLYPAWTRAEPQVEHAMDAALQRAAERAGW